MTADARDCASDPPPPESFGEFLESSRVGYIYADPNGKITRVNPRVAQWLNRPAAALIGTHVEDHLPVSGKVYFQTHLAPLLKMQGFFEEVALELAPADAPRVSVIANGVERVDETGNPRFIRLALLQMIERRQYERNLVAAKSAAVTDNTRLRQLNTSLGSQVADESRERLKIEGALSEERQTGALREQFIAVLGHDLRNPLAAIDGGIRLLRKTPLNDRATAIAEMVQLSVRRMAGLIDNVMDFARGRLGGGMEIRRVQTDLAPVLNHAIEELRMAWPGREIEADIAVPQPVSCDPGRIAQLLSNLLANALTHGAPQSPVRVQASQNQGGFALSVSNVGEPIAAAALTRLFLPFTREDVRPSQQGLGLGLYIASEIARAHGGSLTVNSSDAQTCFTLMVPAT